MLGAYNFDRSEAVIGAERRGHWNLGEKIKSRVEANAFIQHECSLVSFCESTIFLGESFVLGVGTVKFSNLPNTAAFTDGIINGMVWG